VVGGGGPSSLGVRALPDAFTANPRRVHVLHVQSLSPLRADVSADMYAVCAKALRGWH